MLSSPKTLHRFSLAAHSFSVRLNGVSPFFNRDGGCKQKITLWPCSFRRASYRGRTRVTPRPPHRSTRPIKASGSCLGSLTAKRWLGQG